VGFRPEDGMQVTVRGNIDVYAKRGSYQIICESMEQAGRGNLLLTLEERKRRLAAEGLFDAAHKKPLPAFPKRVVVITSPTGAAIRDILQVLGRRAPGLDVVVLPAPVQGAEAAPALAVQLARAQRYKMGDVIIMGRGGGSLEDLLPFSEEILVRAVAACTIPVVSAVGHEIDYSLCDLAASLRAPTPSAAAELVAASRAELRQRVLAAGQSCVQSWKSQARHARQTVRPFGAEEMERSFQAFLQPRMQALDDAKEDLLSGMERLLTGWRHRLGKTASSLDALSPLAVLERGYAVVRHGDGIIESAAAAAVLPAAAPLEICWRDGTAAAVLGAVAPINTLEQKP
jgi:exodeoxyribonuclease VII large subunit